MTLAAIIEELHARRRRFGRGAARDKRRLLDRAAKESITRSGTLRKYHDLLLFILAHPDDAEVEARASSEIGRCGAAARRLRHLEGSGIAHTVTACTYSIDTSAWLLEHFGSAVELDWDEESLGDALDDFLPALVGRVETDGTVHRGVSTRGWFRAARGKERRSDLEWLLRQFARLEAGDALRDRLFESLDVRLRWRLSSRAASRTFQRFPARKTSFQKCALERGVDLLDAIEEPIPSVGSLPIAAATEMIDKARATLAVRHRETDPVTYANPREVYLVRIERGLDVAIFGMKPSRRLPIESFFGYVAAKNRVPIAYGGGWVFLDRCEIGVNIFDEMRGGESAWTFAQICRVYRQLFSARRFTVHPFQFGEDNPDAIRSGAFWFYHRLGFRPTEPKLQALAARERKKIDADPTYRTPPATLRRLAGGRVAFLLDEDDAAPPDLPSVSLAVTRWIGARFNGDRAAAEAFAVKRVRRTLDVETTDTWPDSQRRAFVDLSLLVAMIPNLAQWSPRARRGLVAIMRAKGGRGSWRTPTSCVATRNFDAPSK